MSRHTTTTLTLAVVCVLFVVVAEPAYSGTPQPPKDSRSDFIRSMAEYGRSKSDQLKAVGSFLASMAQVQKTREETRTLKLGNDQKAVEVYFEKKRINRKYREEFHKRRMDSEQAQRLAQMDLPSRVDTTFVSFVSTTAGSNMQRNWPYALSGDEYRAFRQQVEVAWTERSALCNRGTRSCHEIQDAATKMRAILKTQANEMAPMEWIHANQFLKSLAYEAAQPSSKPGNLLAKQ